VKKYTMLRHLPHIRHATQHRAMYIVCMCFVFSYIAFDVLDLDGSNLSRIKTPAERGVIAAEVTPSVDLRYSPEPTVPLGDSHLLFPALTGKKNRQRETRASGFSLFISARSHGYHVGLPRDSVADPSPCP
jgi:hypothetical protein